MKDLHGTPGVPCIAVDLDGTLAQYDGWKGPEHIGPPVALMLQRVKSWLGKGVRVKILTARVHPDKDDAPVCRGAIERWLEEHLGRQLPITHEKDPTMIEMWDDRAVQVIPNTGLRADGKDGYA